MDLLASRLTALTCCLVPRPRLADPVIRPTGAAGLVYPRRNPVHGHSCRKWGPPSQCAGRNPMRSFHAKCLSLRRLIALPRRARPLRRAGGKRAFLPLFSPAIAVPEGEPGRSRKRTDVSLYEKNMLRFPLCGFTALPPNGSASPTLDFALPPKPGHRRSHLRETSIPCDSGSWPGLY